MARMSFRLLSVYESGVIFQIVRMSLRMCFIQCITECFPFAFQMFSVWFQNAFRTDRILPACWFRNCFTNDSVCFPNDNRTHRIDLEWNELFLHAFYIHSGCSEIIRNILSILEKNSISGRSHWAECHSVCCLGVRGENGSYSGSIRCVLGAYWLFGKRTEWHSALFDRAIISTYRGSKTVSVCVFKVVTFAYNLSEVHKEEVRLCLYVCL